MMHNCLAGCTAITLCVFYLLSALYEVIYIYHTKVMRAWSPFVSALFQLVQQRAAVGLLVEAMHAYITHTCDMCVSVKGLQHVVLSKPHRVVVAQCMFQHLMLYRCRLALSKGPMLSVNNND